MKESSRPVASLVRTKIGDTSRGYGRRSKRTEENQTRRTSMAFVSVKGGDFNSWRSSIAARTTAATRESHTESGARSLIGDTENFFVSSGSPSNTLGTSVGQQPDILVLAQSSARMCWQH